MTGDDRNLPAAGRLGPGVGVSMVAVAEGWYGVIDASWAAGWDQNQMNKMEGRTASSTELTVNHFFDGVSKL